MNYQKILDIGAKNLKISKIQNPNLDSELILSKVLNKTREEILINFRSSINETQINKFNKYLNRRKKKEPMAYILGYKYFLEI